MKRETETSLEALKAKTEKELAAVDPAMIGAKETKEALRDRLRYVAARLGQIRKDK